LKTDLFRRDFTVNAMTVCLSPDRYGELIDLYGGLDDLQNKTIPVFCTKRVLSTMRHVSGVLSVIEQRLGFKNRT